MKWKTKKAPKVGTKRVVKKYAYLPVWLGDCWCWLEDYYEVQIYIQPSRENPPCWCLDHYTTQEVFAMIECADKPVIFDTAISVCESAEKREKEA